MITLRSPREISKMRHAGLVVWQAHERARQLIRPGVTTAELDAVFDETFREHGAVPLFKGVPGVVPFPAVTCISVNEEVVHGIPGPRTLNEGDIVSLDTGCRLAGWCGDAANSYAVGQVDADSARLLEVTQRALEVAIDQIPHCERWTQVAAQIQALVEESGFSVIRDFVGHGIGREMHEAPQVPNFVDPERSAKADFSLRPGLVLAIEPMVAIGQPEVVCLSDHWTQITRDRSRSAHFEHTVAITDSGCRLLTGPPLPGEAIG